MMDSRRSYWALKGAAELTGGGDSVAFYRPVSRSLRKTVSLAHDYNAFASLLLSQLTSTTPSEAGQK